MQKVSLRWLKESADPLAKQFRGIVAGSSDCCLCCMFLEVDYIDDDGNTEACSFDEIDESELEHFQDLANYCDKEILITSLEYLPNEKHKCLPEKVKFT